MIDERTKAYNDAINDIKQDIDKTKIDIFINVNISLVNLYYRICKIFYDNLTWANIFLDKLALELKITYPNQKVFSVKALKYMKFFSLTKR